MFQVVFEFDMAMTGSVIVALALRPAFKRLSCCCR